MVHAGAHAHRRTVERTHTAPAPLADVPLQYKLNLFGLFNFSKRAQRGEHGLGGLIKMFMFTSSV